MKKRIKPSMVQGIVQKLTGSTKRADGKEAFNKLLLKAVKPSKK